MALHDLVRFEPNERVDIPDFNAIQQNARSAIRDAFNTLAFGATGTFTESRVLGGWQVTQDGGGPAATVDVAYGTALGMEELPDTTIEYGTALGRLLTATQTIDFTGQPNNTYGVYVRFSHTSGVTGNRIFWNADTSAEEVGTINTRNVADWDVTFSLASPGNEYFQIADVVWAGATVATGDITHTRDMFFEGHETGGFASVWGDGGNDRNTDRGQYGARDLYTWVQAVRRQLRDVIGESQWYAVPNTDLALTATHIAQSTDAHTASPTWTGTVTALDFHATNDLTVDNDATVTGTFDNVGVATFY
ncbi:MAG: hypothetical protein CMB99_01305, partial [Flavobacteriaceae bacterium]|nr:hypothetical protein [Flavobacteriaceae bacterium]